MKRPKISIIVRTKNEEKWIGSCLEAIYSQTVKDIEVIVVDNKSTDRTVEKAKQYPVKFVHIDDYMPGKSINDGIKVATGEYIVCVSAHCIPVNKVWLENLLKNFDEHDNVAGVYGRQEPMSFTSDGDKRDLLLVFGLDKKIQYKDSFFHNANSMFPREIWEEIPFDEKTTNIEDRIWGREIIKRGMSIVYEPEASVYHWHGIHQEQNKKRCQNVVRIIEELEAQDGQMFKPISLNSLKKIAIIPVKGNAPLINGKSLLELTIVHALECKHLDRVIVSTDNKEMAQLARECGAEAPFLRDENLSKDHVDLGHVFAYTINELEKEGYFADIVMMLEITYPFRPKFFLDELVEKYAKDGVDSIMGATKEFRSCWAKSDEGLRRVDEGFIPRNFKEPILIGAMGVGCITHPVYLREGKLLGDNVGLMEIDDPRASIEVRDELGVAFASQISLDGNYL